jgi:mono/diheme cytochrome c family protein
MGRTARHTACAMCLLAIALALVGGCSGSGTSSGNTNNGSGMMGQNVRGSGTGSGGPNSGTAGGGTGATSYSSDGQRLYLTGVGVNGQVVAHSAPPVSQGALMMGGGGCGSCHGANGRGRTIQMMMGPAIKAPDVTYAALIKAGFTDATISAAIRDGLDETGKPLKDAMPRWQMGEADLNAMVAYLKVLGTQ